MRDDPQPSPQEAHARADDIRQLLDDAAAEITTHRLDPEQLAHAIRARRRRRSRRAVSGAALLTAATVAAAVHIVPGGGDRTAPAAASPAATTTPPPTTTPQPTSVTQPPLTGFRTLSSDAQAAIQTPLSETAEAIRDVGMGTHTSVYSGVAIDVEVRAVDLYLTDPSKAAEILTAAQAARPGQDLPVVRVHQAMYTQAQLEAARGRLLAQESAIPYRVTSIAVPADGSGLLVGVETPAGAPADYETTASTALTAVAGVHTTARHETMPMVMPLIVTETPRP